MTEEEKNAAAAYIKLHEDVQQLIVNAVLKELQNYGGLLHGHIKASVMYSPELETKVKDVIKNQMNKH
jgi:hypothetical protein